MGYPFDIAYNYFAQNIVLAGIGKEPIPPGMFVVQIIGSEIVDVDVFPIHPMLGDNAGKNALSTLIRRVVPELPPTCCLVLIAESWQKTVHKEPDDEQTNVENESLEFDPDAKEIILINIYRPETTRVGSLPINEGRKVSYAPMLTEVETVSGRFTVPTPTRH